MKDLIKRIFSVVLLSVFLQYAVFADTLDNSSHSYPNTHVNTGIYQDDIVEIANTQIGYTELTEVNGTPVIDSEIPYYTKYGACYGNPNGHWCAFFVLWCAKQADIPTSIICRSASCGNCGAFVNWFKSNHRWQDKTYLPQKGDIAFFDWDADGSANHVGIVESTAQGTIITIEGNTGGENGYMVKKQYRTEDILGYGIPDYALKDKLNGYANSKQTAYMLPNNTSQTVWEVWKNDELQVLCRDGDYYLVLYPYVYTGKFVAAYIPTSAVLTTDNVPDAAEYYSINKSALTIDETPLYHTPSTDDLMNGSNNNKLRATLPKGTDVTVLFEKDNFLFIKTEAVSGYITAASVTYSAPSTTTGDLNGDNKINSADAGLILRYDAGLTNLSQNQLTAADINNDGKTDSADAGLILRYDAGIINDLE